MTLKFIETHFLLLIEVPGTDKMIPIANRVNIHFENKLAGQKISGGNFDFIYFLLNDNQVPLYSDLHFDKSYLSFLNELGFKTEFTDTADSIQNWWVKDEASEKTKKLNSKTFLIKYLHEKNIFKSESYIAFNLNEFKSCDPSFDLVREEFSVSGRGTYFKADKVPCKFPVILTKHKNRICDIGVRVRNGAAQVYFNLVDNKFCFRGQLFDRKDLFKQKYSHLFNELDLATNKLIGHIRKDFQVDDFQFDSFIYEENGEHKLEFAHEINYRRSMGDTYFALNAKGLVDKDNALLLYLMFPKAMSFSESLTKLKTEIENRQILLLSPLSKGLNLFFLQAENSNQNSTNLDRLYRELGLERKAVYNDIVKKIKDLSYR